MNTKVEFHCHTSNSFDCEVPLVRRLERYASLGFTHLAITDHDAVLNKLDRSLASSSLLIPKVISAIEVSTHVGHIILLDCDRKPFINSLFFLVLWSKIWRAEIYIPHPCRKGTGLLIEYVNNKIPTWYIAWFLKYVKYLEVWNPRDSLKDKVIVDPKIWQLLQNVSWTKASDSHFDDDIYEEGCPMGGLHAGDSLVSRFFSQKIEIGTVDIPLTIRAILRYIKSALRYALN